MKNSSAIKNLYKKHWGKSSWRVMSHSDSSIMCEIVSTTLQHNYLCKKSAELEEDLVTLLRRNSPLSLNSGAADQL